jgi:hypothetical protein
MRIRSRQRGLQSIDRRHTNGVCGRQETATPVVGSASTSSIGVVDAANHEREAKRARRRSLKRYELVGEPQRRPRS